MGKRLERRLEGLEEKRSRRGSMSAQGDRQHWLARARLSRNKRRPRGAFRANDLVRHAGMFPQRLRRMNAQEFVEDVLRRWGEHREHEDERARFWAEREVALAIYTQMQGTENMVCPAEWRTCLVAGDELRAKFAAIPDEVIAYQGISSGVLEGYGVTDELVEKTLGPGEALVDALPPATRCWLYQEILSEVFYGERSYRIATLLRQDPERARAVLENLEAHRAQAD